MKTIEFTQNEISTLFGKVALDDCPVSKVIREKLRLSLKGPENCTVSCTDTEICYTPAKAYEKVLNRKERANIENEKAVAKRMIKELEDSNNEAVEIIRGLIGIITNKGCEVPESPKVFKALDFINNKLF